MSRITLNRWLKPIAGLLVIVFIVMLLIPSELTDEQLAQIRPGMTLEQVKLLIGEPNSGTKDLKKGTDYALPSSSEAVWISRGLLWRPTYYAYVPFYRLFLPTKSQRGIWIGNSSLLWVEYRDSIIAKAWMFRLERRGGGFQGFIDTIKEYWGQWIK